MSDKSCLFCKIVKGEIPCHKIYEDKDFLAFLDVNPKREGHTLIIPKKHYQDVFDIPEEVFKGLMLVVQKLAKKLKNSGKVEGVNLLHASGKTAQQSVFHFHFHLVPRRAGDGLDLN